MPKAEVQRYEADWAGRKLVIEAGKYAPQTNASVTVQYGDTVVLATAVMGGVKEGMDYFPLMVDYEERLYAAGKIKGSRFIKREGRPTDDAMVTARLIDRSIRPLFDQSTRNEVQVVIMTLSWDGENDPALLGLIGASCVLAMSDIPWEGPIAAATLGMKDGKWEVNPTFAAAKEAEGDLFVAGTPEKVVMIEAGGQQVPEDAMFAGVELALKEIAAPFKLIEKVVSELGQEKKDISPKVPEDVAAWREKVRSQVDAFMGAQDLAKSFTFTSKEDMKEKMDTLKDALTAELEKEEGREADQVKWGLNLIDEHFEKFAEELALEKGARVDGRAFDQVRELSSAVGLLPRTHGSGLFQRGETQVLSVVTLGSPGMQQIVDSMEEDAKKRYMHHYNFPGFCVGEVKFMRTPGRREIGHGALAEKALMPVLPTEEDFPYTIRVVSEVLASNGSSSQASACGSTLSLMDAGVPLAAPVAGIAMGVMLNEESGKYEILTDIAGVEDHAGHMDFKVAGTTNGITAIQLDIKASGLTLEIVKETLAKAKDARIKILDVMQEAIPEPRPELSEYAPRIITLHINPDKIKDVIGPGGKIIHEITGETGVEMDIEQDGTVLITATAENDSARAVEWVKELTHEVEVGSIVEGTVASILDFGAIVEFPPKHDGLLHVSEIKPERVERVEDVLKIGDKVKVKVISADNGKIGLSIKQTDPNYVPTARDERFSRPRSGGPRGPRRDSRGGGGFRGRR